MSKAIQVIKIMRIVSCCQ